jgi:uncharacterized protein (DUF2249 family)
MVTPGARNFSGASRKEIARTIPSHVKVPATAMAAAAAPGEAFTLVNNHDPEPLRREFEATHPGAFTWDYLESGPGQWQVRTGRTQVPDTGAAAGRK